MTYEYCEGTPEGCPPGDVAPVDCEIFRGWKPADISEDTFKSFGELEDRRFDQTACQTWGLSVWVTEAAVEFARANNAYVRKWHIFRGKLDPEHGVIKATPSLAQPEHHTLWKDKNQSVVGHFALYLEPEAA